MNWTGGRLQRHSGGTDETAQRQNEHFARAKANLFNKREKSPIKKSLLDRIRADGMAPPPKFAVPVGEKVTKPNLLYDGIHGRGRRKDATRGAYNELSSMSGNDMHHDSARSGEGQYNGCKLSRSGNRSLRSHEELQKQGSTSYCQEDRSLFLDKKFDDIPTNTSGGGHNRKMHLEDNLETRVESYDRHRTSDTRNHIPLLVPCNTSTIAALRPTSLEHTSISKPSTERSLAKARGGQQTVERTEGTQQTLKRSRNGVSGSESMQQISVAGGNILHGRKSSITDEVAFDDHLYIATPAPHPVKRQRPDSLPRDGYTDDRETLMEKRRKILQEEDWLGVGLQHAPQVLFPGSESRETVARRRRTNDGCQARYNRKQSCVTSPFATNGQRQLGTAFREQFQQSRNPRESDVRISIGGKAVLPGISSSSACSTKYRQSRKPSSHRPVTRSSDIMLLDQHNTSCGIKSHRNLYATRSKCFNVRTKIPTSCFWHPEIGLCEGSSGSSIRTDLILINEETPRAVLDEFFQHGGTLSPENGNLICANSSQQPMNSCPRKNSRDKIKGTLLSYRSHCEPSPHSNARFSSSTTLSHPKPQSSRISAILCSNSEDFMDNTSDEIIANQDSHLRSDSVGLAGSTAAQLGIVDPVVPGSQILDNEAWENWMVALRAENGTRCSGSSNQRQSQSITISPGVSAYIHHGSPHGATSSYVDGFTPNEQLSEQLSSPKSSIVLVQARSEEVAPEFPERRISSGLSPILDKHVRGHAVSPLWRHLQPFIDDEANSVKKGLTGGNLVAATEVKTVEVSSAALGQAKAQDEDEIWRKYVFGRMDDEEHGDYESVSRAPYETSGKDRQLHGRRFSMIAQPARSTKRSQNVLGASPTMVLPPHNRASYPRSRNPILEQNRFRNLRS